VSAEAASGPGERRFVGILLAAGAGSRFGGRKLLHRLPDGTPIGISAWRNLRQAIARTIVVIRAGDSELAQEFAREGGRILECADAVLGMGHSLAAGVRAEGDAAGWVVALADMPYVRPSTIAAVVAALNDGARIAVPAYRGERGHPVGFAGSCRGDLLALRGDSGARAVLERHTREVRRLEVDDPGILQDIDTVEDLARLRAAGSCP
jgi:molybdenum cofactor cytidylyltransferase